MRSALAAVVGGFVGFLLFRQLNPSEETADPLLDKVALSGSEVTTVAMEATTAEPVTSHPSTAMSQATTAEPVTSHPSTAMSQATTAEPVTSHPSTAMSQVSESTEECLAQQGLPKPMAYGPNGEWVEVSFLNSNEVEASYRTRPAKCPAKNWKNDASGRPLLDSTLMLQQRAKQVGHPRNGMLNPKGDYVIPKRCSHAVPKILHFIWLCSPLSDKRAANLVGFAKNNPKFQIFFWTDVEIPSSIRKLLDASRGADSVGPIEVKDAYAEAAESFQSWSTIQHLDRFHEKAFTPGVCTVKSHYFRLEAPLKYGGIYIDMDHTSTRGFDEVGGDLWRWPFVTQKDPTICIYCSFNYQIQEGLWREHWKPYLQWR